MTASPIPLIALVLAVLYARGLLYRRRLVWGNVTSVRMWLFAAGIAALLVVTLPPLAGLGARLFSVHQLQHVVLRMVAPLLIAMAHPAPVLVAGLPRRIRRDMLRPLQAWLHRLSVRYTVWRAPSVLLFFIATIVIAQLPAVHNAAIMWPLLRIVLHLALLGGGFALFSFLLDPRDMREGVIATAQGARIYFLFAIVLSNILIGALTALKSVVIYTAYDLHGRAALMVPLDDETVGGFVLWVPSSILCILVIILVFMGWNRAEERLYARRHDWSASNSAALMFPETAQELRMKVADPNRKMGLTLGLGTLFIFLLVMSTMFFVHGL